MHEKDKDPQIRLHTLPDGHPAKKLPEADQLLTKLFKLCGFNMQGGMGATYLTWQEVQAFSDASKYNLSGWEAEQLIQMSRAFVNQSRKAQDIDCLPPYTDHRQTAEEKQQMRARVSKKLDSMFASMTKK